jgi:hypothetical protein
VTVTLASRRTSRLKKKLAPLSAITLRPLCCRFVFGLRWQPEIDRHIHVATVARTNELNIPLTCGFEDGMSAATIANSVPMTMQTSSSSSQARSRLITACPYLFG